MSLKFNDTDLQKTVTERVKIFAQDDRAIYANKTARVCTFMLRYYDGEAKKQRIVKLGAFHPELFNCKRARKEAGILRGRIGQGENVAKTIAHAAVVAHNGTKMFCEVADLFIAHQKQEICVAGRVRPRKENWIDDVYALTRARAAWAKFTIVDVTDDDIKALLEGVIAEKKNEMARAIISVLKRMFFWAGSKKFVVVNPMAFITSVVMELPPSNKKTRYLDEDEVRTLWHGLDRHDIPCDRRVALALKLILVTALRPSEIGCSRRRAFGNISKHQGGDGLPALRLTVDEVKKRRVIVQPMSSLALELIGEAMADGDKDGPLFKHGEGVGSMTNAHYLSKMLRSQKAFTTCGRNFPARVGICEFLGMKPFTSHDLRRTATTLLGLEEEVIQRGGEDCHVPLFDRKELTRILDHKPKADNDGGSSAEVYDVSEHVQQTRRRRPVLNHLDKLLRGIIGDAPASNVVRINTSKKAA